MRVRERVRESTTAEIHVEWLCWDIVEPLNNGQRGKFSDVIVVERLSSTQRLLVY